MVKSSYSGTIQPISLPQFLEYTDQSIKTSSRYSWYTSYSCQLAFFIVKAGFAFHTSSVFVMHKCRQVLLGVALLSDGIYMFLSWGCLGWKFLCGQFFLECCCYCQGFGCWEVIIGKGQFLCWRIRRLFWNGRLIFTKILWLWFTLSVIDSRPFSFLISLHKCLRELRTDCTFSLFEPVYQPMAKDPYWRLP